jgi:hypothetical protein
MKSMACGAFAILADPVSQQSSGKRRQSSAYTALLLDQQQPIWAAQQHASYTFDTLNCAGLEPMRTRGRVRSLRIDSDFPRVS